MTRTNRVIKPVLVHSEGEQFEIHLGRPGKPHVYLVLGEPSQASKRILRRLADEDKRLPAIARDMRAGVDDRKAREAAEAARRRTWRFRLARWLGTQLARFTAWARRCWPSSR